MIDWQARWQSGEIGWHQADYNARLLKHINKLGLAKRAQIFVPLFGKSLDMLYLLNQGYQVIGVELSELAVLAFFDENKLHYACEDCENFKVYTAKNITLYVGDFFHLTPDILCKTDAVYDRASLIALPELARIKYAKHLCHILPSQVKMLLLTLYYPQAQKSGPPFAVDNKEVLALFGKVFHCVVLEQFDDLVNEPRFIDAGIDFLQKGSYLLERKTIY